MMKGLYKADEQILKAILGLLTIVFGVQYERLESLQFTTENLEKKSALNK
ncbi:hypothetical protein SAMN03097699_1102 [Flavobacteriaceae bacterium MAR_2010_188]|nr:hypothetical protein SAMN03097699_1102 [Flavobacteriaceae bacterium MAR_2010_188]